MIWCNRNYYINELYLFWDALYYSQGYECKDMKLDTPPHDIAMCETYIECL